jgi:hypothetical protein
LFRRGIPLTPRWYCELSSISAVISKLIFSQVVPSQSAILPGYIQIGIRGNHLDMTKFEGGDDPGFVAVAGELRRLVKESIRPESARSPQSGAEGEANFDSDYGSMPDAVSKSKEQDDGKRSIRSIITNASRVLLPPQEEEHLISAFAGDLCQDIGFRGDLDTRDRISSRLPDLLKTFTLRLEESVNSKRERDAKEFVRQQRE